MLKTRAAVGRVIAAAVVSVAAAGCTSAQLPGVSASGDAATRTGVDTFTPGQPVFDPPRQFSTQSTLTIDDAANSAIGNGTLYDLHGAPDDPTQSSVQIRALDMSSGDVRWSVPPPGASFGGPLRVDGAPGPLLAAAFPHPVLFYVATALIQGQGTQRNHFAAQVGSLSADTGAALWTVRLDLPLAYYQDQVPMPEQYVSLDIVGADEHHLAIRAAGPDGTPPITWVLDPATGRTHWTQPGIEAIGLGSNTVAARPAAQGIMSSATVAGLSADTGAPVWTPFVHKVDTIGYAMVGTRLLLLKASDLFTPTTTYLLDMRSGQPVATLRDDFTCKFDQVDTVACQSSDTLVGLDAATGKQLWSLPDPSAQRIMPSLGAAYHGLLYTHGENTGVILDARTGADVVDNGAVSPQIVIPGYGIESGDDTLTVYPAIG